MKYLNKEPFSVSCGWCSKKCKNRSREGCDNCFRWSNYEAEEGQEIGDNEIQKESMGDKSRNKEKRK